MQIETIGKYQLHFIALEVSGGWDAYLTIMKFNDTKEDFKCVLEKHQVSDHAYATYDDAIEAARLAGNALIEEGRV